MHLMVFVGNFQKSPIASHLQGLDPAVKVQLSQAERNVNKMSVGLTLEASEMFLSLHMIFSLERDAVVWAILIGAFIRDDCSQVNEVLHCF